MRRRLVNLTGYVIVTVYLLAVWTTVWAQRAEPTAEKVQTVETELLQLRMTVDDQDRRLRQLEQVKDLSARIAVLEDNMSEVKWLSRTVAAAFVTQLLWLAFGSIRDNRNGKRMILP